MGWGLGIGDWGLGFGDWGLGIGAWGTRIRGWAAVRHRCQMCRLLHLLSRRHPPTWGGLPRPSLASHRRSWL
ncbi:MAG: hypothetical protein B7Z73_19215 [Planctomycetia bacterium 21-64-5]|nr:MAG: hypothetical protein B7Z73_19215 [Planctomycetia bacterium 21-64-5]